MTFNVVAKDEFRNPFLCLDWSSSLISVKLVGLDRIEEFDGELKCYSYETLFTGDQLVVELEYRVFGTLDNKDYINVSFYDKDNPIFVENIDPKKRREISFEIEK